MFGLFEHRYTKVLWLWTRVRYNFVGSFGSRDAACSFAHNILGHATSATFTVFPITRAEKAMLHRSIIGEGSC